MNYNNIIYVVGNAVMFRLSSDCINKFQYAYYSFCKLGPVPFIQVKFFFKLL